MTTKRDSNEWFVATVEKIVIESPMVKSLFFKVPHALTHLAGQHYELRLTAENGYQAARLFSAATPGDGSTLLQLTIMNVPEGEVSPYVALALKVGDDVELRGPFGKFFVWSPDDTRPVLLIGGGSGVVPMHAMLAAHRASDNQAPMKLLYSARRHGDILFKDAFIDKDDVLITLTRETAPEWPGFRGRITEDMVRTALEGLSSPICYICGMSPFVDTASELLLKLDVPAEDILTERFG